MEKKVPLRQCLGCRTMKQKRELVRIIRTKDGQVLFDSTGKKSGRGAYICNSIACYDRAVKTGAINRALETTVPAEILDEVRKQIQDYE